MAGEFVALDGPEPSPEEPPPEKVTGERRCEKDARFRPEVLRSTARAAVDEEMVESPYGLEIGAPALSSDAIWVPLLRSGQRSSLTVLRFDRRGEKTEVALGNPFGDVGPPRLAAALDRVLGVEFESAARGRNAKLFSIEVGASGFELVRGPELAHESLMDDSLSVGLSSDGRSGLIVREAADGGFEMIRLSFSGSGVGSAKAALETARPTRLSLALPSDPALSSSLARPELTPVDAGFVLTFVRLAESAGDGAEAPDPTLVEVLGTPYLALLDDKGGVKARPVPLLSSPRPILRVTTGARGDGFEALIQAPGGSGAPLAEVARVSSDGNVARRLLKHPEIHAGENVLFLRGAAGSPAVWLLGGGDWPLLREPTEGAPLVRELGMEPADPLGSGAGEVVAATPRGLDLELGLYRCAAPAP